MNGSTHQWGGEILFKEKGKDYNFSPVFPLQGAIEGIDLILLPLHWSRSSFSESRERIRTALASVGVGPSSSPPTPSPPFRSLSFFPHLLSKGATAAGSLHLKGGTINRTLADFLSLSLSLSHTHTHTYSLKKKSRD